MVKVRLEWSDLYEKIVVTDIKGIQSAREWVTRVLEKYACFSCCGDIAIDWESMAKNEADRIPFHLKKRIVILA